MIDIPEEILKFIPQRPPFVMVDALEACEAERSVTGFTVREGNVLLENGCLSAAGVLENIAQSAAAGTGAATAAAGLPAPVGFIGAVKNFQLNRLPATGERIRTEILFGASIGNARLVDGTVFAGEEVLAKAGLTIFIEHTAPAS